MARVPYLVAALVVLALELVIAMGHWGSFVRGTVGDVLGVALVYACLRAACPTPLGGLDGSAWRAAAAALAFGVGAAVELAQVLRLADRLALAPGSVGRVVLGATPTWSDVAAYAVGALAALLVDALARPRSAL